MFIFTVWMIQSVCFLTLFNSLGIECREVTNLENI